MINCHMWQGVEWSGQRWVRPSDGHLIMISQTKNDDKRNCFSHGHESNFYLEQMNIRERFIKFKRISIILFALLFIFDLA